MTIRERDPLVLGTRLPDPFFDRVRDRVLGKYYMRRCNSCLWEWPTVEVPMLGSWDGERADSCPVHVKAKSSIVDGMRAPQVAYKKHVSPTMMRILMLGGYYRRRECRDPECKLGKTGGGLRWSTVELLTQGLVVEDVGQCPRCDSLRSRARTLSGGRV